MRLQSKMSRLKLFSTFASAPDAVALDARSTEMGVGSTAGFRSRKYVGRSGGEDADSNAASSLAAGYRIVKDVGRDSDFARN